MRVLEIEPALAIPTMIPLCRTRCNLGMPLRHTRVRQALNVTADEQGLMLLPAIRRESMNNGQREFADVGHNLHLLKFPIRSIRLLQSHFQRILLV